MRSSTSLRHLFLSEWCCVCLPLCGNNSTARKSTLFYEESRLRLQQEENWVVWPLYLFFLWSSNLSSNFRSGQVDHVQTKPLGNRTLSMKSYMHRPLSRGVEKWTFYALEKVKKRIWSDIACFSFSSRDKRSSCVINNSYQLHYQRRNIFYHRVIICESLIDKRWERLALLNNVSTLTTLDFLFSSCRTWQSRGIFFRNFYKFKRPHMRLIFIISIKESNQYYILCHNSP